MKIKESVVLLISIYALSFSGVNPSIRVSTGLNINQIHDVRWFLQYYAGELNLNPPYIPAKVTKDYGINPDIQIEIVFQPKNLAKIGIFFENASTNGQINYTEYSGELNVDIFAKRYNLGLVWEKSIYKIKSNQEFVWRILPSFLINRLIINGALIINTSLQKQETVFEANSLGIGSEIAYQFSFNKIFLRLYLGFLTNIPRTFHLKGNSDAKLVIENEKEIKIQWNTIKLGLTLGLVQ